MRDASYSTDPQSWEVHPGLRICDLVTPEHCDEAILSLDMDREKIMAQIAEAEADPSSRPPGWRSRAQAAMRWKGRIAGMVKTRAVDLRRQAKPADEKRRKALLAVIYDEVGEEEFARFASIAEARHPELFQGGGA